MNHSQEWERLPIEKKEVIIKYHSQYPVKLGALAKELGLVVKLATLPANISGEIKDCDGVVTIRVNQHDSMRKRSASLSKILQ